MPTAGTDEVLTIVDRGVGHIELNRPHAINALTMPMIEALLAVLTDWASTDQVERVVLTGAGNRGLCAGADVRAIREQVVSGTGDPDAFFGREYRLNALIEGYPKPYEARMSGIVMGGGLGLSAHGSLRIVDSTSRLAMPETGIGLFPDVGITWLLAQAPGELGTYLALTGATVDAATGVTARLADGPDEPAPVPAWISEAFAGGDAAEIVRRLEGDWDDPAPGECAALLRTRSPWSVCVSLEALRRAARMGSVVEVLAQDLVLARHLVRHPDFAEGVRAQLVDKDRQPTWTYARIEDVPHDKVLAAFEG
ncbi:MAG TPA: enoyl-CoA hydratase/isomerase family protein [Propionibacteriaceae bacterium]|nr:enoyl-CoA hydratase/isomerase family protein [Propionibacteriaceae bacterium]